MPDRNNTTIPQKQQQKSPNKNADKSSSKDSTVPSDRNKRPSPIPTAPFEIILSPITAAPIQTFHTRSILTFPRKQTLANAERYIIPELKELEDTILGAEDKLYALEYQLYSEVRDTIGKEVVRIQKTAKAIAKLDAFASLALVAEQNNYVRPKMNDKGLIDIKDGRHPVVEKILEHRGLKKLLGTYIDALPQLINPRTGRVHTSFNQTVTATGRLS